MQLTVFRGASRSKPPCKERGMSNSSTRTRARPDTARAFFRQRRALHQRRQRHHFILCRSPIRDSPPWTTASLTVASTHAATFSFPAAILLALRASRSTPSPTNHDSARTTTFSAAPHRPPIFAYFVRPDLGLNHLFLDARRRAERFSPFQKRQTPNSSSCNARLASKSNRSRSNKSFARSTSRFISSISSISRARSASISLRDRHASGPLLILAAASTRSYAARNRPDIPSDRENHASSFSRSRSVPFLFAFARVPFVINPLPRGRTDARARTSASRALASSRARRNMRARARGERARLSVERARRARRLVTKKSHRQTRTPIVVAVARSEEDRGRGRRARIRSPRVARHVSRVRGCDAFVAARARALQRAQDLPRCPRVRDDERVAVR